ncbi:hypothetical protein NBRC3257_3038 [Gluconobacter thailandicus NBRC 3257]|uniref:Uncharacterized protein n=1 Tax=Gluconobacter thailandicus NBRC 3257 TaxID=1381097 RepID=A0ABQ0J0R5_GLUTH|nr:hypothetical protein NBRC3257_3038 [Gluconobacter thailandicus NBRC 3257]
MTEHDFDAVSALVFNLSYLMGASAGFPVCNAGLYTFFFQSARL